MKAVFDELVKRSHVPAKPVREVTRRELRQSAVQAAMIKRGTLPSAKEIFAQRRG